MRKDEKYIYKINFYSGQERLVGVGWSDELVKYHKGRVEIFEIAADERLIGAELDS